MTNLKRPGADPTWTCKVCGVPLSEYTVHIDNGGALCRQHAAEVRRERYGDTERERFAAAIAGAVRRRREAT